ncbi:MAG: EamA family transporter [Candidatus Bathyarchaeota archaeon]|nr:MAG: EamA family transporter [Candidatus Bathyarchaeota archaeon]
MKSYLLIASASILWGTMGILAKLAFAEGIEPLALIALRLLVSSTTLGVVLSLFNRKAFQIQRVDVLWFLGFGAFAIAFQRVSYFYSVDLTTPAVAAILFFTYPVFVVIFSMIFLSEKASASTFLAAVLTLFGASLAVRAYDLGSLRTSFGGIAFGLGSSLLFVVYVLMTKKLRRTYSHYTSTFFGDVVGALLMSPIIILSIPNLNGFSLDLWILIISIAWGPSLLAYLLYSYAMKQCDAVKGSIIGVVEPISATLFSTFLLMEKLELLQVVGIITALTGVAIVISRKASGSRSR